MSANKLTDMVLKYQARVRKAAVSRGAQKWKMHVLGQHTNDGWLAKMIIYLLLSCIAYLYLQPLFYIISTTLKDLPDLLDPTVQWIPRNLYLGNLKKAWIGLVYPESFANTMLVALVSSVFQVFTCAVTGYALARLRFPGRNLMFFLVILTFLIPPQIVIIPLYVIFSNLGWLNTPYVFLIPALFGQGLRSALFVIIFRQFFKSMPMSLEEAAKLDGASVFRLFMRIMLPLSKAACLVVFLFSFIWYWNQSYAPAMFLTDQFIPLSLRLNNLEVVLFGSEVKLGLAKTPITEGAKMAGALLIILPPLIVYAIMQRWFVEGIERTGAVE